MSRVQIPSPALLLIVRALVHAPDQLLMLGAFALPSGLVARIFKEVVRGQGDMHWRRKLGITLVFTCMPAMAPLWSMGLGVDSAMMIRVLTVPFVFGVILALAGNSAASEEEE